MRDDVAGSVFFVALAPVADPALVTAALAQVSGAAETGAWTLTTRLREYMRDKALRLVIDNLGMIQKRPIQLYNP